MNNPYLRRKMAGRFFLASMLSALIFQINGIADGIIVSHAVTPDAISAIGLATPVMTLILLLAEIVCNGGSIIAAKWIGAQNYRDASRMNSVCFISMSFVYILTAVITVTHSEHIANFLTAEPRLRVLLYDYLPVSFVSVCILSLTTVFYKFIACAGKPILVTRSLTVMCITNILLDLLFVVVYEWGIKGAAWSTLISGLLSNLVYIKFYVDKDCIYKAIMPKYEWFKDMFASAFTTGLPTGLGSLSSAVLTAVLNAVALKTAGADGLFVLTVGMQMLLVCSLVLDGTSGIISSIGGILLGEKDIDGYRAMVVNSRKSSIVAVGILTLLMVAFPEIIARLFGASDQLVEYSRTPLREFCLLFIPYTIITLFSVGFQVQGHKFLASMIMTGKMVFTLCITGISLLFCPEYVWLSGFFGLFALQLCTTVSSWFVSSRHKDLHPLTLIEHYPEHPNISESVPYTKDGVSSMLDKAQRFLDICDLPPLTVSHIRQCIEELSSHIVDMAFSTHRKGFFDVRIVDEQDGILVVIKDDNRPFNPIYPFHPDTDIIAEEEKAYLVIIIAMCPNIKHQYINGVNCTYLKFHQ